MRTGEQKDVMRIVLNALPTTTLSGRHVLGGYVSGLRAAGLPFRLAVLCHRGNMDFCAELGADVECIECPPATRHWMGRAIWERVSLRRLLRQTDADLLIMTSGCSMPRCPVPQLVVAMNPWCFVPEAWGGPMGRMKAWLQRMAYRRAVREADAIVYLSAYLRDEYHRNAGREGLRHLVAHTTPGEDVAEAARRLAGVERIRGRVLCVSAMAPHKGVETLVEAVARLRDLRPAPFLVLAGGWPDRRYEGRIRALVARLGLGGCVQFAGHLSREDLLREYVRADVFALLSLSESFGIPGLEAQAFGTPVVCARTGAMSEVYGEGAHVVAPRDPVAAAAGLREVLTNRPAWERLSQAARSNCARLAGAPTGARLAALVADAGACKGRDTKGEHEDRAAR